MAVFEEWVQNHGINDDYEEILESLAGLRAKFAIQYALEGFNIEWDKALEMIRETTGLSEEQQERRRILVAAVDNIVDFAVAEEYQMLEEILDLVGDESEAEEIWGDIFEKYNLTYANVEDMDIAYAMHVADMLAAISSETWLEYNTQRDDRVRPWHAIYDGFMAPKFAFPEWLIPPIEWQCRCYLEEVSARDAIKDVRAQRVVIPNMPEWFDRTFEESVAFGGRIFSEYHPYFSIDAGDRVTLDRISGRIKEQYFSPDA